MREEEEGGVHGWLYSRASYLWQWIDERWMIDLDIKNHEEHIMKATPTIR